MLGTRHNGRQLGVPMLVNSRLRSRELKVPRGCWAATIVAVMSIAAVWARVLGRLSKYSAIVDAHLMQCHADGMCISLATAMSNVFRRGSTGVSGSGWGASCCLEDADLEAFAASCWYFLDFL